MYVFWIKGKETIARTRFFNPRSVGVIGARGQEINRAERLGLGLKTGLRASSGRKRFSRWE